MRKYSSVIGVTILGATGYFGWKHRDIGVWKSVTEDEVIYSWLKAEATDPDHQFASAYKRYTDDFKALALDNPSFNNYEENKNRRKVFNKVRGNYSLWKPIHKYTSWYKTKMILNNPFRKIFGPYYPESNKSNSPNLNGIILWGHSEQGPFIVLEGNHRWYARKKWLPYICVVYVGISQIKYPLHATSGCDICKEI